MYYNLKCKINNMSKTYIYKIKRAILISFFALFFTQVYAQTDLDHIATVAGKITGKEP